MKPYFERDGITIYHGDCLEILPLIDPASVALLLADPPYGISLQFGGVGCKTADPKTPVQGDAEEFDPKPWLAFRKVVLWGANHYANRLPISRGWLIWDKAITPNATLLGEAEMAWSNCLAKTFIFRHLWNGYFRASERGFHVHPTQKPVALMRWVLEMTTQPGDLVFDPYMGSGPVAQACYELGRRYVGVEIEERYCEIAARRLSQSVLPLEFAA